MTRFRLFLAIIVVSVGIHAIADQRVIGNSLRSEYQSKLLVIRGLYVGSKIRFDSQGNVVSPGKHGYWSSDGMFEVESVNLKEGVLRISGHRVVTVFDGKIGKFRNFRTKQKVEIAIEADPSWTNISDFQRAIEKNLTADTNELAQLALPYWSCWLSGTIEPTGKGSWKCIYKSETKQSGSARPASTEANSATVTRVGGVVTAPQALFTPDPDYTEAARTSRLEGTSVLWVTVNERGEASEIQITRPIGAGLDDKAVEAVRKWKFAPAMKDGHPVPVQINIEVNFRLY